MIILENLGRGRQPLRVLQLSIARALEDGADQRLHGNAVCEAIPTHSSGATPNSIEPEPHAPGHILSHHLSRKHQS
jgi:hypothetical protein